jgi:hypothetical protein
MARELGVNLSMEWQCEQLACANALPAATLGAALHGIDVTNAARTMTTAGTNLVSIRSMKLAVKPTVQNHRFQRIIDGFRAVYQTACIRAVIAPWQPKCTEIEMSTDRQGLC